MIRLLALQGYIVLRAVQIQPQSTCMLGKQKGKAEQGEGEGGALASQSRAPGDNETLCPAHMGSG